MAQRVRRKIDTSSNHYGTVLNAQTLEHAVQAYEIGVEKIIVIENKANYESMEYDPKVLYIFCHGYFSPKRNSLFANVNEDSTGRNPVLSLGRYGLRWNTDFLYNEKIFFQI